MEGTLILKGGTLRSEGIGLELALAFFCGRGLDAGTGGQPSEARARLEEAFMVPGPALVLLLDTTLVFISGLDRGCEGRGG